MQLIISEHTFDFTPEDTKSARDVFAHAPIELTLDGMYGGEIFGLTDIDLPLSDAREVFAIGDVVYWRSQKSEKKAIAIFFRNTPKGEGDAPRPASACDLIGRITVPMPDVRVFEKGMRMRIEP